MANDKNTMNELVLEDDANTAELEALADTYDNVSQHKSSKELPSIVDMQTDLQVRSETIDQLQFDIEQLRARWTGLEAEIRAREELTIGLNTELKDALDELVRKNQSLEDRDQTIKSLQEEMRTLNLERGELETQRHTGRLTSAEAENRELRIQIERIEAYADDIRRQLQERMSLSNEVEDTREHLQFDLERAAVQIARLEGSLEETQSTSMELTSQLTNIRDAHSEEIRTIRFELGAAQETLTQHEVMAEQLASDLVHTRGFRDELEQSLLQTEKESQSRIEELERENRRQSDELEHNEEQLENKSDAINCLLAELAKKSPQIESIGEIEDVIHEIDDRKSERIDDRPHKERGRVSRVLIGSIDGQELRFPLFKDRLTIGRAEQNDIQLQASCVSRRHAVVVTDQESTRVIDWGSRNGVFVNTERVTEHFLRNGDAVTIGTAKFRYEERPKRDS